MKKLILIFILLIAIPCFAADVVLQITIPDQYVAKAQEWVNGELRTQIDCEGLNDKQCLEKFIRIRLKDKVDTYRKQKAAREAADEVEEIELQ